MRSDAWQLLCRMMCFEIDSGEQRIRLCCYGRLSGFCRERASAARRAGAGDAQPVRQPGRQRGARPACARLLGTLRRPRGLCSLLGRLHARQACHGRGASLLGGVPQRSPRDRRAPGASA